MKNSTEFFIVHSSKYLGVALVAGSVVHWGTLGGNQLKYIGFFLTGSTTPFGRGVPP